MTRPVLFTLADAAAMWPASRLVGDGSTAIRRVHSDTRTLQAGDCFVALKGERFDGEAFLGRAREAGAAAAVATGGLETAGLAGLEVADAQAALEGLAAARRERFGGPLIAVAGSNGKTTVTQMIASILAAWHGDAALATRGNLNNHIGLPLTLLRLRVGGEAPHRAAVVELGMNHPGEIARLAAIARPTVAVVTNAQREHQEFMDGVEAVARENGAAIAALGADGVAVFPADDAMAPIWSAIAGSRRTLRFSIGDEGDCSGHPDADTIRATPSWQSDRWRIEAATPVGPLAFDLYVPGRHNAANALAATAAALAAGAPPAAIEQGLGSFRAVAGRSAQRSIERGGRAVPLVDDSYNANPDSVRAAIDLLASMPPPGWLLLGDMGEVGEDGPAFHAEVGAYARSRGVAALWTAGRLSTHAAESFGGGARHFDDVEALCAALEGGPDCAAILVKGSRFMAMERVVEALDAARRAPSNEAHAHAA